MRRPSVSRASTAVAVVAAIVAVLAVMLPGLGFGQTSRIHGGSPNDVFMRMERHPETCAPIGVNIDSVTVMPLQVEVAAPSHLLAYFSFEFAGLESNETAQVNPELVGAGDEEGFLWRFVGNATGANMGETVMSSFPNVEPGTHTVDVFASVAAIPFNQPHGGLFQPHGQPFADLSNCVLTVFVIPVAP